MKAGIGVKVGRRSGASAGIRIGRKTGVGTGVKIGKRKVVVGVGVRV
jgi:hypothetical protein